MSHSEIKRKLIEDYGIPAHEIRFVRNVRPTVAGKLTVSGDEQWR